jgi:outer membrane protein TolC
VSDLRSISRQISAMKGYLPTQRELVTTYHDAMLQGNADVLTYYTARDELISTQLSLLDLQLQLVDRFVALEIEAGEDLCQPQKGE